MIMEKKEAMKILKEFRDKSALFSIRTALDTVIPELKESEDEKMKEAAKYGLQHLGWEHINGIKIKDVIAWLEKQGHDGKKWIYEDVYFKEKEQVFQDGVTEVLENPQKYGLEKQGERDEERKEINLVEILKHYPRETELYSPLYGKLWLAEVDEKNGIITCYKHHLEKGCTRAVFEQEDTVSFYSNGTTGLPDFNVSKDCMLFLYDIEKQGEQKPADKVEPKFKVGDWCIDNGDDAIFQITKVLSNLYYYRTKEGKEYSCTRDSIERNAHLWTIQDAKDGDVLYCKKDDDLEIIVMYLGINIHNNVDSYCRYNSKLGFNTYITNVLDAEHDFITPATKEQRSLLFQKMKEAGYERDADKNELKNIEQKIKR